MADEEIVSGLKQVKDEITRHREDDSKQTGQLSESINKLRSESNQKSDGIVGTLTSSLEKNAAEVASEFIIQKSDHRWQKEMGMHEVDDEVSGLRDDLRGDNTEQKSILQRIAAWVNPDMQGSKDRERDLENKLNFNKQTQFFANMAKSLKGMVVRPITTTAAGIWTFLKGLAFGGALLALLNFLDGDTWKNWQEWVVKVLPEKITKLKSIFKSIMDGDFMKAWEEIGKLFEFAKDDESKEKTSLLKEHWGKIAIALGILAAMTPTILFGGAYAMGKWLFVKPLLGLGKALLDLTKVGGIVAGISGAGALAAGTAAARAAPAGRLPQAGAIFEQGGKKYSFNPAMGKRGGEFVLAEGPGKGKIASAGIQAAGRESLGGAGRWNKLINKFSGLKKIAAIGGRFAAPLAVALTGYDVYNILMGPGTMDKKITAVAESIGGALGAGGMAALGAAIGAVAGSSFPIVGTLLGTIAGGSLGYFGGQWAGRNIAELMLGDEELVVPKLKMMSEKGDDTGKGLATNLAAAVPTGGKKPMTTTAPATSLAAAVPTGGFEGGVYDLAMAPTTPMTDIPPAVNPVANQLANASFDKATRNIVAGRGEMIPPIIAPTSNQVINNNSNIQVAAKDMSHPSYMLNQVNFAT